MKLIEIEVKIVLKISATEICSFILDTSQWSKFEGYSILPGIEKAEFQIRTPYVLGSKIKVYNTDGSTHIEEIVEWDADRKVVLKFQEFNSPLKKFATHFIEEWNFTTLNSGTEVRRSMKMYPKNLIGWIILKPISVLMKKALEKNLEQLNHASIK